MKHRRCFFLSVLMVVALGRPICAGAQEERPSWQGQIEEAVRQARAEAYDEAFRRAEAALEMAQGDLAREGATHNVLGRLHELTGDSRAAVQEYELALKLFAEVGDIKGQSTVNNNLIRVHGAIGMEIRDDEESQAHYNQAEEYHEQVVENSKGDPRAAAAERNLAALYANRGQLAKALEHSKRAIDVLEQSVGYGDERLADDLDEHALLLEAAGSYDEAQEYFRRALQIRSDVLGPGDVRIPESFRHLGRVACRLGDREAEESFLERSVGILRRHDKTQTLTYFQAAEAMARLRCEQGRWEFAETQYQEAMARLDELGSEDPRFLLERTLLLAGWTALKREWSEGGEERYLPTDAADPALTTLQHLLPELRPPLRIDAVLADLLDNTRCGRRPRRSDTVLLDYTAERQRRLQALGYYEGEVDGQAGPQMERAVQRFRREAGLGEGTLDLEADTALGIQSLELAGREP